MAVDTHSRYLYPCLILYYTYAYLNVDWTCVRHIEIAAVAYLILFWFINSKFISLNYWYDMNELLERRRYPIVGTVHSSLTKDLWLTQDRDHFKQTTNEFIACY